VKGLFPQWEPFLETYFLTCLLHDIGTTDANLHGTRMSFEYYGAFVAINFLKSIGAPSDQAEAVGEAIVRHADIGKTGNLTSLGQLIQLSTLFGESSDVFDSFSPCFSSSSTSLREAHARDVHCASHVRTHEDK
jgi:cyanamide hydratase family protein with HD domain